MKTPKIQLSNETKNKISSLSVKEQLKEFLMSDKGCISIEDAIKEAEKLWPRSK